MIKRIQAALTPDLLLPRYRGSTNPLAGHCYAASEALYHLLGGKEAGYRPVSLRLSPCLVHWWIEGPGGEVLDPTARQFSEPVAYHKGRGRGFLTRQPSARADEIIRRIKEV